MLALTRHETVQDGYVLAAAHAHALRAQDCYVAEKPPQAVLVDYCLLQEPVPGAVRDEFMEFGIQLEELDAAQLLQPIGQQGDMYLPQPLRARPVQLETRLEDARRLDQKAKPVTVLV